LLSVRRKKQFADANTPQLVGKLVSHKPRVNPASEYRRTRLASKHLIDGITMLGWTLSKIVVVDDVPFGYRQQS
jgi:hypothetical protein